MWLIEQSVIDPMSYAFGVGFEAVMQVAVSSRSISGWLPSNMPFEEQENDVNNLWHVFT